MIDFIKKELSRNSVDYKKVINNNVSVLYNEDTLFDVNFIIPVRGRMNFAAPMYNSFLKAKEKSNLKIAYTIVEFSDIPEHSKFCKNHKINYVWIQSEKNELFNKCLCLNVGALFTVKSKYFLFHDIDCLIQSDFFEKLFQNIATKNCKAIQCFHGRRVLYLNQDLTDKVIQGAINIDSFKLGTEGINLPQFIGAPGGSIFIEKDLFFKVGGYDPELFKANAPEDIFFWSKVDLTHKMEVSDNPEIDIFHLNHPPTYYDNPMIQHMTNIYNVFKDSTEDEKKEIITLKEQILKEFYYE